MKLAQNSRGYHILIFDTGYHQLGILIFNWMLRKLEITMVNSHLGNWHVFKLHYLPVIAEYFKKGAFFCKIAAILVIQYLVFKTKIVYLKNGLKILLTSGLVFEY